MPVYTWNDPALRDFECPKHGFHESALNPDYAEGCEECQNIRRYGHPDGRLTLPDHPYVQAVREYRDWYRESDHDYGRIVDVCNAILGLLRNTPVDED